MKIHLTREIKEYNKRHWEEIRDNPAKKMTYKRLAGLTMCSYSSGPKTKVNILARMNAGKSSHPDLQLVWIIATTLGISITQLISE
ncbi:MAG TPA: hypothetical protein VMV77_09000 [Bacteroidales bacterium]|nr:hypothetical protein [Bacteroidales bacterium]